MPGRFILSTVEPLEKRHFRLAGSTPTRPEVDQDQLTSTGIND
jgi:hypothetical protein